LKEDATERHQARGTTECTGASRIHRSTIVNVHRIREIQPWFHGYHVVLLENGQELRMSRYKDTVAKQLGIG